MTLEDKDVLESFRGMDRCECCHKRAALCGHHYWITRGAGGGTRIDHPFNLIGVCLDCHQKAQEWVATGPMKQYSRHALLDIVSARENVSPRTIVEFLQWLSRTDRNRAVGPQVRLL